MIDCKCLSSLDERRHIIQYASSHVVEEARLVLEELHEALLLGVGGVVARVPVLTRVASEVERFVVGGCTPLLL